MLDLARPQVGRPRVATRSRRLPALAVTAVVGTALLAPLLPAGAAVAGTAAATPSASATLARTSTATAGLFGASDATYDGVFRQGLAITGLVAAGRAVPPASLTWLRRQQCADGSFEAFRASLATPCRPGDPTTYTGTDTNSTALGAMALLAVGDTRRGRAAASWLRRTQNRDGGFPFYPGGASDANSTGLALAALRGVGLTSRQVVRSRASLSARTYLARVQAGCSAPVAARGGIAYQGPAPIVPNDLATAQAALGAVGTLPVARVRATRPAARLDCGPGRPPSRPTVSAAANGYLAARLRAGGGTLPNAFGPGPDLSATAWSVLALVSARSGPAAIAGATRALRRNAADFVRGRDGTDQPGALGLLLLVARATGSSTTSFGGVDLVSRLRATRRG